MNDNFDPKLATGPALRHELGRLCRRLQGLQNRKEDIDHLVERTKGEEISYISITVEMDESVRPEVSTPTKFFSVPLARNVVESICRDATSAYDQEIAVTKIHLNNLLSVLGTNT